MKRAALKPPSPPDTIIQQLQPKAIREPGSPSFKIESSTQLAFCIRTTFDASIYDGQPADDDTDWWIRVCEDEVDVEFEPGDGEKNNGLRLKIAQSFQLYGHGADANSKENRIDACLSIHELRALFAGMTLLRERMQAAGFVV